MSANTESISRDVIAWEPRVDIKTYLARIQPSLVVGIAGIMTYGAMHYISSLPRVPAAAFSRNITIPRAEAPIPEVLPVDVAPPANLAKVNGPISGAAAPAPKSVMINVPPQDVVVVAMPPSTPVVINNQARPVDVPRKLAVAASKSPALLVWNARHASTPHVRRHKVVVEANVEPLRRIVREPRLREVTALAPRPVPTPGLFPLPLKIFLADIFGGPRP